MKPKLHAACLNALQVAVLSILGARRACSRWRSAAGLLQGQDHPADRRPGRGRRLRHLWPAAGAVPHPIRSRTAGGHRPEHAGGRQHRDGQPPLFASAARRNGDRARRWNIATAALFGAVRCSLRRPPIHLDRQHEQREGRCGRVASHAIQAGGRHFRARIRGRGRRRQRRKRDLSERRQQRAVDPLQGGGGLCWQRRDGRSPWSAARCTGSATGITRRSSPTARTGCATRSSTCCFSLASVRIRNCRTCRR